LYVGTGDSEPVHFCSARADAGGFGKKLLGAVLCLKDIRERYPKARKEERVYVKNEGAFYIFNGTEWEKEQGTDFAYLVTKAAKEFGWLPAETLALTRNELSALFEVLPRVNNEAAFYTALAFNDPEKITTAMGETMKPDISDRERNEKGIKRLREVTHKWR
jgi:hypothetical protein